MNSEMINAIKDLNRMYLLTPEGHRKLELSIKLKREWLEICKKTDTQTATQGVSLRNIDKRLHSKITKIEITPIGLNNHCHHNSEMFCMAVRGMEYRIGYNITSCSCGKRISYELHSVNKFEGKLYDFTRDFNNEKDKYFLELDTDLEPIEYIRKYGKEPMTINKGCECPINWNINYNITEKRLIKLIELIEN